MQRKKRDSARTAKKRASETQEEALCRQERDRACTAKKRASETQEEALCRQERNRACTAKREPQKHRREVLCRQKRNRACTAKKRASETQEEVLCRQECDRVHIAKKRAFEAHFQRKQSNRIAMTNRRSKALSVECAMSAFHAEVKLGPEFVCACCHRMMYRKSVILCNRANYTKANTEILQEVFSPKLGYISSDGKEWVCKTCNRTLKRGTLPLQAKANGLQLCPVPPELSGLNALELRLICQRVPFMKMVALHTCTPTYYVYPLNARKSYIL